MKIRNAFLLAAAFVAGNLSAQTLSDYQSVVTSQSPATYFKLDNSLESAVDPNVVLQQNLAPAGGFAPDVYRNGTNSYFYVNQPDFLAVIGNNLINGGGTANTTSTAQGSISFLFRTLPPGTNTGQRYVFSGGGSVDVHNALTLFLENTNVLNGDPNSYKLRFGDQTITVLPADSVEPNTWYYFALTYNESPSTNKATWYLGKAGGTLISAMTTNSEDSVAGDGLGSFYIGSHTNGNAGFRNPGSGRIDEFAIWNRALSYAEVTNQFAKLPQPAPPGASYQQVVDSQIPKYYFKLDDSLVESVGNSLFLSTNGESGAFTGDFLGNPNRAYSFSATNDALYIANDLINGGGPTQDTTASGKGTISLQFRMLSDTNNSGQRFIFAAPAIEVSPTDDNQLALFLDSATSPNGNPNSLKLRVGNTTKGNIGSTDGVPVAYPQDLVPNAWYYFAMTYDESRNTPEVFIYFGKAGGTLTETSFNPANNSVVGDNGTLWIGNEKNLSGGFRNPGPGAIDEFAIWHDELTADEIKAQFAAMTATPATPPVLGISRSGNAIVLSWPSGTDASYVLESASVITSTTWTNAGSPTVVGSDFVVTNVLSTGTSFYRLSKP